MKTALWLAARTSSSFEISTMYKGTLMFQQNVKYWKRCLKSYLQTVWYIYSSPPPPKKKGTHYRQTVMINLQFCYFDTFDLRRAQVKKGYFTILWQKLLIPTTYSSSSKDRITQVNF
jgi:hypothetical protein